MRICDEITSELRIVDSVSTYIKNLQKLQNEWCEDNWFMVYRGETVEYANPCIPTIYRGFALKQNENYEINMFMAMRQSNISESDDYLHNAIDAQHDGFPSRLLDVTYNSLVALYFAVTPYYYKDEASADDSDGIVYVIKYDEAYSPESSNTKEIYSEALKGSGLISNSHFLSYHHILIDHCKQNKRIIAQQGAFILFTGESPIPIPHYQMCGIRVSKDAKERIRNELRYMFGIYTGSVYPEVELMQEEIKERCMRINTYNADLGRTTKSVLKDLELEYDYFADCCDYYISTEQPISELVRIIEKNVVIHKFHLKAYLEKLYDYYRGKDTKENSGYIIDEIEIDEKRNNIISQYNVLLEHFVSELPQKMRETLDIEVWGPLGGKNNGENM